MRIHPLIMVSSLAMAGFLAACTPPAKDTAAPAIDDSTNRVEPAGQTVPAPPVASTPANPDVATATSGDAGKAFTGKWTGVEGMYLTITPKAQADSYELDMQWDLDNKGKFDAKAVGDTLVFTRNGKQETLRKSTGDATGLKYLAGKTDCVMVKSGEGYCR